MIKLHESELIERKAVDQILSDKQAWLDRKERNREKLDKAADEYNNAVERVLDPVKSFAENLMSKYSLLKAVCVARFNFGDLVELRIDCGSPAFRTGGDESLHWEYTVTLDPTDGTVKTETGSFSGLQACTAQQINHLKQTVQCLEELNGIDWKSVLAVTRPSYKDFDFEREDETPEYDYDAELTASLLGNFIGSDTGVLVRYYEKDQYHYDTMYLVPVKETGKKFECIQIPCARDGKPYQSEEDMKERYKQLKSWNYTNNFMKAKIKIVEPMTTIDLG